jgi:hypothetical protein
LHPHGHREVGGVAEEHVGRSAESDEVGKRAVLGAAAENGLAKLAGRVGGLANGGAIIGLGRGVSGVAVEGQVRDQTVLEGGMHRRRRHARGQRQSGGQGGSSDVVHGVLWLLRGRITWKLDIYRWHSAPWRRHWQRHRRAF